jgi:hypothetical protein
VICFGGFSGFAIVTLSIFTLLVSSFSSGTVFIAPEQEEDRCDATAQTSGPSLSSEMQKLETFPPDTQNPEAFLEARQVSNRELIDDHKQMLLKQGLKHGKPGPSDINIEYILGSRKRLIRDMVAGMYKEQQQVSLPRAPLIASIRPHKISVFVRYHLYQPPFVH